MLNKDLNKERFTAQLVEEGWMPYLNNVMPLMIGSTLTDEQKVNQVDGIEGITGFQLYGNATLLANAERIAVNMFNKPIVPVNWTSAWLRNNYNATNDPKADVIHFTEAHHATKAPDQDN